MKAIRPRSWASLLSLILLLISFSASAQDSAPKIAFISNRDGMANVHVMEADGSNPINLTNSDMGESGPAWSPDGQMIAFSRAFNNDGAMDIFTIALDGSAPTQLTDGKLFAGSVVWSPDGSQLAFNAGEYGVPHLTIINADGSGERLLVAAEADSTDTSSLANWSPDGTQIIFRAGRGEDRGDVNVINSDGSGEASLNNTSEADTEAIWSPDGKHIAFVAGTVLKISVMNADGSAVAQLGEIEGFGGELNWSPDGSLIAFSLYAENDSDIYVVNVNNGDLTNLTDTETNEFSPKWSLDGSQLIFVTDRDGNYEIYSMNADGSNPVNLTNNPADDNTPRWQPIATGSITAVSAQVQPTQPPAPNASAVPVPEGLQVISSGNAGLVSEVLVSDPDEFDPAKIVFEGALAGNNDWIRAITMIGSIGGLEGPAFTPDYGMGAIALVDSVGVVADMNSPRASSELEQWKGTYNDLTSAAFSPDGTTLAVGDGYGVAALWDIATGAEIAHWQAHSDFLNTVQFTPDGSLLMTLGYDGDDATIGLWDPRTGEAIKKVTSPSNIYAGALNADASLLAAGGDGNIVLWDVANETQVAELVSPTDFVSTLTFSPDGSLLAMGDEDGIIYLFDVAQSSLVGTLKGQVSETDYLRVVVFMSFSPDGSMLLSSNRDGLFHFWGTTAEAGAAPQPEPTADADTVESSEPTPAESSSTTTCSLTANGNANLRSGPGTTFDRAGALSGGEVAEADAQNLASDGFTWYRLASGGWVRADLVTAAAECAGLAEAS